MTAAVPRGPPPAPHGAPMRAGAGGPGFGRADACRARPCAAQEDARGGGRGGGAGAASCGARLSPRARRGPPDDYRLTEKKSGPALPPTPRSPVDAASPPLPLSPPDPLRTSRPSPARPPSAAPSSPRRRASAPPAATATTSVCPPPHSPSALLSFTLSRPPYFPPRPAAARPATPPNPSLRPSAPFSPPLRPHRQRPLPPGLLQGVLQGGGRR